MTHQLCKTRRNKNPSKNSRVHCAEWRCVAGRGAMNTRQRKITPCDEPKDSVKLNWRPLPSSPHCSTHPLTSGPPFLAVLGTPDRHSRSTAACHSGRRKRPKEAMRPGVLGYRVTRTSYSVAWRVSSMMGFAFVYRTFNFKTHSPGPELVCFLYEVGVQTYLSRRGCMPRLRNFRERACA